VNYANHGHAFTAEDWIAMPDFFDKCPLGKSIDRTFDRFPTEQELDAAAAAEAVIVPGPLRRRPPRQARLRPDSLGQARAFRTPEGNGGPRSPDAVSCGPALPLPRCNQSATRTAESGLGCAGSRSWAAINGKAVAVLFLHGPQNISSGRRGRRRGG